MRLIFYSGGEPEENSALDSYLIRMVGKTNPTISFWPAGSDGIYEDVRDFNEHYLDFGIGISQVFNPDKRFTRQELEKSMSSDLIYLGGGNTFYFLDTLRQTRLMDPLKEFAEAGNVLAGKSAGAIMMTPSIHTAGFPEFDRDHNGVGIKNFDALSLVPFEFFPHYQNHHAYDRSFLNYTATKSYQPLWACRDGSGIVVYEDEIIFVGDVYGFVGGRKFPLLNPRKP